MESKKTTTKKAVTKKTVAKSAVKKTATVKSSAKKVTVKAPAISLGSSKNIKKRQLVGTVMSNKMEKSVTVRVINKKLHPLYKKIVKQYKKYMAHNELEDINVGDRVRLIESKPMSKHKRWVLVEKLPN
jgi:small subunit ribosomal protein S17